MRGITNQAKRQITALTGLRILAALWVLFHHLDDLMFSLLPGLMFLQPFIGRGSMGVDLFFILSGFILTYQYLDRLGPAFKVKNFLQFVKLRIARVYPVHFVTLHMAVAMFFAAQLVGFNLDDGDTSYTLGAYIQHLFLVHAWADQPYSWNMVSWSVSAEWFAYLLFPLAVLALFRVRNLAVMWIGVAAPVVTYFALQTWVLGEGADDRPDHVLLRIAVGFTMGCFLARIFAVTRTTAAYWRWLTPAALLAVIVLCYVPDLPSSAFIPPLALLVLGLAHGQDAVSRFLALRPLVYGGEISYCLYMVHALILAVAKRVVPAGATDWNVGLKVAIVAAIVGLVLLASHIMFRWVEEPSRKYIRNLGAAKRETVSV